MLFEPKEKGPIFNPYPDFKAVSPSQIIEIQIAGSKTIQKALQKKMMTPAIIILVILLPYIVVQFITGFASLPLFSWITILLVIPFFAWFFILIQKYNDEFIRQEKLHSTKKQ